MNSLFYIHEIDQFFIYCESVERGSIVDITVQTESGDKAHIAVCIFQGTFEKCNEIELLLTQDNSTQTLINNAKRQEKRNLEKEKQRPTTTKRMFEQDQQDEQGHLQVEREILFERQELNRLNGEELNEHGGIRKRKEPELVQEDAEEAEKSKETKRPRHDQQQLKKLSDSDFYIITKTIENFL